MSLINDALKRAKQAHQDAAAAPAPIPPLRPVEAPQQSARRAIGILLPVGLAVVALVGLVLFWVLLKKESPMSAVQASGAIPVSARTTAAPEHTSNSPDDSRGTTPNDTLAVPSNRLE